MRNNYNAEHIREKNKVLNFLLGLFYKNFIEDFDRILH